MNRGKLLISLAVAGALSVGLGSSLSPAAAERRVVVTLVSGQTLVFTGELPCDSSVAGALSSQVASVSCQELAPAAPPPPPPSTSTSPPPSGTTQTQPPDSNTTTQRPAKRRTAKTPRKNATRLGAKRVEDLQAQRQRRTITRRRDDGVPTPANPTFALADPGPAPIGVPNFFIEKFRIPPFLLRIYQAAGVEYGVPWQVLAAINEIETDYGRNLNVSSAGAMGWMQFIPSSWKAYGVDANDDGKADPYNPVDAIFAAARYLKAAGADKDLRRAIYAYNHAWWYVDSVMLRAKLIGGLPDGLVGAITGLTEGRFPVAARATYADDVSEREALRRAKGANAAKVVESSPTRRGINIYSKRGAPVIAVNDGVIKAMGRSRKLGNFIVLQDAYGNRFTYSRLGRLAVSYPAPKPSTVSPASIQRELEMPPKDPRPKTPASAGRQPRPKGKPVGRRGGAEGQGRSFTVSKARLFAHPSRPRAYRNGGQQQMLQAGKPVAGYTTFEAYFKSVLGLKRDDVVLKPLKPGAQVIAGTVLGRIDKTTPRLAPHVHFTIRPTGRGAPEIDPTPILNGWQLLEKTAIYRAAGRNPFFGPGARNPSIGQIMLMSKDQLEHQVLSDPRIEIYDCGRTDIQAGQIDRRVLATVKYLAASGLKPRITSLTCGHSYLTSAGTVSDHSSGNAVDIAAINGVPILGHQGKGSITDIAIRQLLKLQGPLRPHQIISLMKYPGQPITLAMADHHDHIHVGFPPLYGQNPKLARQFNAVLKPGQWIKLIARLNEIDNPRVSPRPSKSSIPVRKSSRSHRGE